MFIVKITQHKIYLLLAMLAFNASWAQPINTNSQPKTSVDIALQYISQTIITSAKQMPKEHYIFQPTSKIRSFGKLLAHIAESVFEMTAIAKGEIVPVSKVPSNKVEVIKALEKAFAYAAKARETMTKEQKERLVMFNGSSQAAGNVLDFITFHSLQHYGNIIVYMRLKDLIPPSSQ